MYSPTTGVRLPGAVRFTMTIFEILPYCPKYSCERRVGMSCGCARWRQDGPGPDHGEAAQVTHLLLGKPRPDADDVHDVALHDPHVGEVLAPERIQLLAFSLPLLLLLSEALMTARARRRRRRHLVSGGGRG